MEIVLYTLITNNISLMKITKDNLTILVLPSYLWLNCDPIWLNVYLTWTLLYITSLLMNGFIESINFIQINISLSLYDCLYHCLSVPNTDPLYFHPQIWCGDINVIFKTKYHANTRFTLRCVPQWYINSWLIYSNQSYQCDFPVWC